MDFLDPRKQRQYKIRLMIGYVLMAIAIGLAALVLVYAAYGYSINTKTGDIVQNSLLFVDSKPGGANIYLNGAQHSTTSARLTLPAGDYVLKLTKSGYRDWQRTVELDEHAIARYVYPLLFPLKPISTLMESYATVPTMVTESPDYRWLLVEAPSPSATQISFSEYDTTKPTQAAQTINLPDSLLTDPTQASSSLTAVEWSTDNNHVLLKHVYSGGTEFIIFDRTDPGASLNVNRTFGINPTEVALRNKSIDQLYIYDGNTQTLQVADTQKAVLDPVFLSHVLAFKAYGSDLLTYVTDNKTAAGQVQARIWDNGPTYLLYTFTAGKNYLIDAAQYSGHWYYIAGSDSDDRINIFQDPLNDIKNPAIGKAIPTLALRVVGADRVSFSTNTRFVEVENGQSFGVYDFETQTRYQYTLKDTLAGPLHWMDGHRLIGEASNQVFVTDYDGTNQQLLVPTIEADGGYFSSDYNHLFTLQSAGDSSIHLSNVDMRAGSDLPKS